MPNTSSSVPFLLSSSMQSIRSRRPSACLSSSQGSGLLQQLGTGMVRQQPANGRAFPGTNVRQCPSLSISSRSISLCLSIPPTHPNSISLITILFFFFLRFEGCSTLLFSTAAPYLFYVSTVSQVNRMKPLTWYLIIINITHFCTERMENKFNASVP